MVFLTGPAVILYLNDLEPQDNTELGALLLPDCCGSSTLAAAAVVDDGAAAAVTRAQAPTSSR